jgi:hypothetical protein
MSESPDYLIVLYSKYSPQCKSILQVYKESMDWIKLVCIDNKTVRSRLLQSTRIKIRTVPCVLMMYPNNKIEKFEGAGVCEYILEQISRNSEGVTTLSDEHATVETASLVPQGLPQGHTQARTSISTLGFGDSPDENMVDDESPRVERIEQSIRQEKKTIKDIAAEMQAGREDLDKPTHEMKREIENTSFEQGVQAGVSQN